MLRTAALGGASRVAPDDPRYATDDLLLPGNRDQLVSILTYHVVPGRLLAADVVASQSLATVQGKSLTVTIDDGVAKVDNNDRPDGHRGQQWRHPHHRLRAAAELTFRT